MNPEGTISGNDVPNCSEEERKVTRMRETSFTLFMQMELEACRNELDWIIKCYLCAVHNYPEEYCPPIPLPVLPGYNKHLGKRAETAAKGILLPTLIMVILKKYYPPPVRQSPVPPHPEIPSCSSSLPCTEPESSRDDQTKSDSLEAPLVDGPKEEQSEIPLTQACISGAEITIGLQGTERT